LNEIKALLSEHDLTLGMKYDGWILPEKREENTEE
jgi:DNA-directed RNA polymerase subunit alpha